MMKYILQAEIREAKCAFNTKYEEYKEFICTFDGTANTLQKRKEVLEEAIRDKLKASFRHEGKPLHQNEFDAIIQVCPFVKTICQSVTLSKKPVVCQPIPHFFKRARLLCALTEDTPTISGLDR